jgi:hypothetical protein
MGRIYVEILGPFYPVYSGSKINDLACSSIICTRLGGYEILSSVALHRCIRILIFCHAALCSVIFMSFDVRGDSCFTNLKRSPVNLTMSVVLLTCRAAEGSDPGAYRVEQNPLRS